MRKELHEMAPSEVLRERFRLEAALEGTPSVTGAQLEGCKNGIQGPGHNGAQINHVEEHRLRLMDAMHLTKDLNPQELKASRLRYWELSTPETYQRIRLRADMVDGDGEECVGIAHDEKGDVIHGYVQVKGTKQRLGTFQAVAERMAAQGETDREGNPMRAGGAERRVKDALEKVGFAVRGLQFKMALEEGAS